MRINSLVILSSSPAALAGLCAHSSRSPTTSQVSTYPALSPSSAISSTSISTSIISAETSSSSEIASSTASSESSTIATPSSAVTEVASSTVTASQSFITSTTSSTIEDISTTSSSSVTSASSSTSFEALTSASTTSSASLPCRTNFVFNGGFETGDTFAWGGNSFQVAASGSGYGDAEEGDYFAVMTGPTDQDNYQYVITQTLSGVAQGDKISCSGYFRSTNGEGVSLDIAVGSARCAYGVTFENGAWLETESTSSDNYITASTDNPLLTLSIAVNNEYSGTPRAYIDGIYVYNVDTMICRE